MKHGAWQQQIRPALAQNDLEIFHGKFLVKQCYVIGNPAMWIKTFWGHLLVNPLFFCLTFIHF